MQRAVLLLTTLMLTGGLQAEAASTPASSPVKVPVNQPLQARLQAEVLRPVTGSTPVAESAGARGAGKAGVLKLVAAGQVKEGEVMFYTLRISNPHPYAAEGAVMVIPVPANTQVIADSMTGAGAQIDCSMDGGATFVNEEDLPEPVTSAFGNAVLSCTHLRWRLKSPLPPGAVLLARFRAEFR